MKVSWQVTGVRHDAYANVHGIAVEQLKPEAERGFYFYQEGLGQPGEKKIDRSRPPAMAMTPRHL